jgi:hydroxyacylglutathione hydrolase
MSDLIPLEDKFADIVGKAMRGLKLSAAAVAARAGLSESAVSALGDGSFDAASARAVAPVLGLGAEALVAAGLETWKPHPVSVSGLACFNTVFEDMTVNSYLAYDKSSAAAVAFDTGADCSAMLAFIEKEKLSLKLILLTHTHADHILDLAKLHGATGAPAFTSDREPTPGADPISPGQSFACGALSIEARSTWGHSQGGLTYVIRGLERPVAVVGDAVFAGSMGGGGVSYADALRTNRISILSLADNTVLCPGHGPLTTVGEEKTHNPFFSA